MGKYNLHAIHPFGRCFQRLVCNPGIKVTGKGKVNKRVESNLYGEFKGSNSIRLKSLNREQDESSPCAITV